MHSTVGPCGHVDVFEQQAVQAMHVSTGAKHTQCLRTRHGGCTQNVDACMMELRARSACV
eukprot:1136707-Pelagomonas_calceolata.AAC.1